MFYNLYEACGNKFLILALSEECEWKNNKVFRQSLCKLGKERKVDSVLVLTGDPGKYYQDGYHCFMEVFEPHADSVSTMCGNGIRAVCQFWIDHGFIPNDKFRIQTYSGLREVILTKNALFQVNMGLFSLAVNNLTKYVNTDQIFMPHVGELREISFGREADKVLKKYSVQKAIIGMTGNIQAGKMDGEPHLVFFVNNSNLSLNELKLYGTRLGKIFTHNKNIFPLEINTSVVVQNSRHRISVCTYERGVHYVTQSCGTASVVAGGYILATQGEDSMLVDTLGGQLKIQFTPDYKVFLTGGAQKLSGIPQSGRIALKI